LIIAPELSDMRRRLKTLDSKDGHILFVSLYSSWCHNAVATFSLCLLAQAYEHASNLLQSLYFPLLNTWILVAKCELIGSGDIEITVQFLIQVDKLVQMLESPVFTCIRPKFSYLLMRSDLRLQLLEPEKYPYLFKCLYGLLMLLPQSSAFATLRNRLNSISPIGYLHLFPRTYRPRHSPSQPALIFIDSSEPSIPSSRADRRAAAAAAPKPRSDDVKWAELLEKFRSVQFRHEKARSKAQILSRSPHIETNPPNPALGPLPTVTKRNVSAAPPTATAMQHKRGRSLQTITQGIMGVGRSGETKKVSGSKR